MAATLSLWQKCLERLEKEISPEEFNIWIRPLQAEASNSTNNELTLYAPNSYVLTSVKTIFLSRIEQCLKESTDTPLAVHLKIMGSDTVNPSVQSNAQPETVKKVTKSANKLFTFSNFVC